ncbi:DUF2569 domain-containing protein [Sphingomonas sp. LHG3443-2]|uniref:DUF2569 domain-containing protein n=1 Tax=Sphingomonas sp. LHG3443-2 TaxID=2804639 RepID=UPI003CE7258E
MIQGAQATLHARSLTLLCGLQNNLGRIALWWMAAIAAAASLRIAISPLATWQPVSVAPYLLLVCAPVASCLLALRWFADGPAMPQPRLRLARVGRWRDVPLAEAERHPLYGTSGIMVSLLIGMLLNVPVRAAEYLVTMPAITPAVPGWLAVLHHAMTLDVVIVSSLYVIAFAMALRRAPMFPGFLALVWLVDVSAQLLIARAVMATDIPATVATSLHGVLQGNVTKVAISASLWLPYLLMSTRVNVTFRHRLPR